MRNIRSHALVFALASLPVAALAQGESLSPLGARPAPEAFRAERKSDAVKTHFIYDYLPQSLPVQDDFSIDRTRKRWAQPDDPGVTLNSTVYYLEVDGASTWDMEYSSTPTFLYTTDLTDPPVTSQTELPSLTATVRNLFVYPPTEETVQVWPAYNVFDTIQSPSPDVFPIQGDLVQDSLLVYDVPADTRTFVNPDNSIVPLVLWEDDDVYVNGTYPMDPPTVGVATFDGLARNGYPYMFENFSAYGIADHLTTVPIDLSSYQPIDSLYLSFFFQPQGRSGDVQVQPRDSLVLELWAPDELTWYPVWRTPYLPLQPFEQVLVPIKLTKFLKSGFRFRFLNYATLSGSFDHWHLDYVRLSAQRTFDDTRIIDVAYVMPECTLLETYTSVPFSMYAVAPAAYMTASAAVEIKNLDNQDRFITYGMLAREENAGPPFTFNNGLSSSGNAASSIQSAHPINSAPNDFTYDASLSTDDAFWRVKYWTNATPDINRYNDTLLFIQELSNYLAYDDGSAEMGYNLTTAGAKLAYRFDIVGEDSLRAVRMYFNPIANDPEYSPNPDQGSFLLTVWSSLSPEVIIHQDFTFSTPTYRLDGINRFVEYPLDSVIAVSGTFYVGYTQTNAVRMNLGFDRNRNNRNKIFYKTGVNFLNTTYDGSLMMRPVFVAATDPFAAVPEPAAGDGLTVFPSPATDMIRVAGIDAEPGSRLLLLDATGRVALNASAIGAIDVAGLAPGLYVARLLDRMGQPLGSGRLLIQH